MKTYEAGGKVTFTVDVTMELEEFKVEADGLDAVVMEIKELSVDALRKYLSVAYMDLPPVQVTYNSSEHSCGKATANLVDYTVRGGGSSMHRCSLDESFHLQEVEDE